VQRLHRLDGLSHKQAQVITYRQGHKLVYTE